MNPRRRRVARLRRRERIHAERESLAEENRLYDEERQLDYYEETRRGCIYSAGSDPYWLDIYNAW